MIETPPTTSLYCVNHPQTETMLRCNRCERPICSKCAILTPTGYRCKDCVRGQQKAFDTALWYDYLLAVFIGGLLSLIGSYIATFLGFFTLFIAPIAGVIIAETVRWATQKRRSRWLYRAAAGAAAVGGVILPLVGLVGLLVGFGGSLWGLIWGGVYATLVTSTVFYRLSGIQIR